MTRYIILVRTFPVHRSGESPEVRGPEVKVVHDAMFVLAEHKIRRPSEESGQLRVLTPEVPLKVRETPWIPAKHQQDAGTQSTRNQ